MAMGSPDTHISIPHTLVSSGKLNFDWHFHSIGGFSCCCLEGFIEKYIGNASSAKKLTFHSLWGSENKWNWKLSEENYEIKKFWAERRTGGECNKTWFNVLSRHYPASKSRKEHKLDWGSIRSSPRYGLSTPYWLTIRNSARLSTMFFSTWETCIWSFLHWICLPWMLAFW